MAKSIGKIRRKLNKAFDGKVSADKENKCLVLTGELERWHEVVKAGMIAAREKPDIGIVNKITCTVDKAMPPRHPRDEDTRLDGEEPDVLIIGGGVIGCAVARELSRYNLKLLLIEKEHDVAMQASGHCTGLVHSGIKLRSGSKRLWFTKKGSQMLPGVCEELGVPYRQSGQYFINPRQMWAPFLVLSRLYWLLNGIKGIEIANSGELHIEEPGITGNIGSALHIPYGGVVCPHSLTIAYAENAAQNGARIALNTMATEMDVEGGVIRSVTTNRGTIRPKVVVNAAGLFCEDIADMAGDRFYSIHPVRGTIAVIDKSHSDTIINNAAISANSGAFAGRGKGKWTLKRRRVSETLYNVLKTVHGTALIGPFYVETMNKEDYSTDRFSIDKVINDGKDIIPDLDSSHIIKCFSGVCASTYEGEFIVKPGKEVSNMIHAAGIQFPGLTASPAIAEEIANRVVAIFGGEYSLSLNPAFNPRRVPPPAIKNMDPNEHEGIITTDPDYGVIICHCEQVSRGEISDALNRDVPCDSLDGVKRRTRAGCGPCQGQFCAPSVLSIISDIKHVPPQNVRKSGQGSEIVFGNVAVIAEKKRQAAEEKARAKKAETADKPAEPKLTEDEKLLKIAADAEGKTIGADKPAG